MNYFKIDYTQKATNLLKEAFTLKKYKAMPLLLAILTGICMIPVLFADLIVAGFVYLFGFFFNLALAPIKFLHAILSNEGKDLKHATQFVIYFLSWSIVFAGYVYLAVSVFFLSFFYAILSMLTYICSLGGFKFHTSPDIEPEHIKKEVNGKMFWVPLVYCIINIVLLLLAPAIISLADCIEIEAMNKFFYFFKGYFFDLLPISVAVSLIYSPAFFGNAPKDKK